MSSPVIKWNWRRKSDGEPLTCVLVKHYLTRDEMVTLLCAHVTAETGTKLSRQATLDAIRTELASATCLEPIEFWSENWSEEEAGQRQAWAESLITKLAGAGPLITKAGKVLTSEDVQALADEAERGYDVDRVSRHRG